MSEHRSSTPARWQDLAPGDRVLVTGYREMTPYVERVRALGLVPGTSVEIRRRAPLGSPIEIRFRGFSLALRPAEAVDVLISPSGD